ncbi:hypothetical protein SDC9_137670 [bioreactor metagenome]|uniref:Uncharacterized protein n=1 Tax=bioreactor metagenome TaxID=1076179 RepID=A0A645DMN0_9ZZZZ
MLFADDLDNEVRHLERGSRLLKQSADKRAENNDDADAFKRPRETLADGLRQLRDGNPRDYSENKRHRHDRKKRMDLIL